MLTAFSSGYIAHLSSLIQPYAVVIVIMAIATTLVNVVLTCALVYWVAPLLDQDQTVPRAPHLHQGADADADATRPLQKGRRRRNSVVLK